MSHSSALRERSLDLADLTIPGPLRPSIDPSPDLPNTAAGACPRSLRAACPFPSRETFAQLPSAWRRALLPLLGERPAPSSATGEESSGQPIPAHLHPPVLSHCSPHVPSPTSRPAATAQPTPNVPIQDHPTRRHRGRIQATTGHSPPKSGHIRRKSGHIWPETGHIRQKSGHIGSDGVDTCLSDGNASLRLFRVRR